MIYLHELENIKPGKLGAAYLEYSRPLSRVFRIGGYLLFSNYPENIK